MALDEILQQKPSKFKIGFFAAIFLTIICGFIWAICHSAILFYEQNFLSIVITYIIFFFNYYYLGTDKNRVWSSSHVEYIKTFADLLTLFGTVNSWIFLLYFGYKYVWYYPVLLYILTMATIYFFALINIFKPYTTIRTLLPFLAVPFCGILLWVLV